MQDNREPFKLPNSTPITEVKVGLSIRTGSIADALKMVMAVMPDADITYAAKDDGDD